MNELRRAAEGPPFFCRLDASGKHVLRFPVMAVTTVLLFAWSSANAEPGRVWERVNPAAGWSDGLKSVAAYAASAKPTAMMIVQDGRVVASTGDIRRKVNVASVRKSLLGALTGIAIADVKINLDSTLAALGIDDTPPKLTDREKTATVRDLLMSRSGIYHPAAYETRDMKVERPARGSHRPGEFWWYNNWDFNALGTIYRRQTGDDIFESFARRIATPIGMEDFSPRDGNYVTERHSSHAAYPFLMSARDAARFGVLVVNGGRWNGRQIIPADWIRDSTSEKSRTDRGNHGYGYLWWTLPPDIFGPGAAYASGNGGQIIAIIPSKKLVAVQIYQSRQRSRTRPFIDLVRTLTATAP